MKHLKYYLPHLTIALALSLATITVLNEFNPMMGWITSTPSKVLIGAFCLSSIAASIVYLSKKW